MKNYPFILFTFLFITNWLLPFNSFAQDAKEIPGLKKLTLTIKNYDTETHTLISDTLIIKEFNKNAQLSYYLKFANNKDTVYFEKTIFNDKGKPISKVVKETKRDFFAGFGTGTVDKLIKFDNYSYQYDLKGNEIKMVRDYGEFANDTLWKKKNGQYIITTSYKYATNDSILTIIKKSPGSKGILYFENNKYGPFGKTYSKVDDDLTYFTDDSVVYKWNYDKAGNKTRLTTLSYYSKKVRLRENYFYSNNQLFKIERTKDAEPAQKKVVYISNNKTDSTITYRNSERVDWRLDALIANDTLPSLSFYKDFRDDYPYYRKLTLDKENRVTMAYLDFDGIPRLGFFEYKDKSIYPSKIERFSKNLYEIEEARKYPDYVMEYKYEFH